MVVFTYILDGCVYRLIYKLTFERRATSVTKMTELGDNLQPFEVLGITQRPYNKTRTKYPITFALNVTIALFVFSLIAAFCYLITEVNYLQSMVNDYDGIRKAIEKIEILTTGAYKVIFLY